MGLKRPRKRQSAAATGDCAVCRHERCLANTDYPTATGASERTETTSSNAGGPGRALREPRRGATGDSAARSGGMRPARSGSRAPAGSAYSIVPCSGDPDLGSTRDFRRGERAYRERRRDVAARQREPPGACLPEAVRRRPFCNVHRRARSGCSCSSKRSTDPTTRARRGRTTDHGLPVELGFPMVLDPTDADSPT